MHRPVRQGYYRRKLSGFIFHTWVGSTLKNGKMYYNTGAHPSGILIIVEMINDRALIVL